MSDLEHFQIVFPMFPSVNEVLFFVGFLISWSEASAKTTKIDTPRIKSISQYLEGDSRQVSCLGNTWSHNINT